MGGGSRRRRGAAAEPAFDDAACLVELLSDVAAALEPEAHGRCNVGRAARAKGLVDSVARLQRACQVSEPAAEVVAGAGRVPLPSPSDDVDAAFDALARAIAGGCAPGAGRGAAGAALLAVAALAFCAPQRAALLTRHVALVEALVGALGGARGGDASFLEAAHGAAVGVLEYASAAAAEPPAIWHYEEGGGGMRALAIGLAAAFGALADLGGVLLAGGRACDALIAAVVVSCPTDDQGAFRLALAAQVGFAEALRACVARAAATVSLPGSAPARPRGSAALVLLAALCSADAVRVERDEELHVAYYTPPLTAPQPERAPAERLLAASPALLDCVADVVAAGAPWYSAVAGALAPGARRARGGGDALEALLDGFMFYARYLWAWAVSLLEVLPLRALMAGGSDAGGRGLAALMGPALLDLATATQTVGASPDCDDSERANAAALAAAAARLFAELMQALGSAADVALGRAPDGVLAAVLHLSCSDPPALKGPAARHVEVSHCSVRLSATEALASLCECNEGRWRMLTMLALNPATAAEVGAIVRAPPPERRLAFGDAAAAACLAKRRALAAGLLADLAALATAGMAQRGPAPWLRRLATCRPFLEGCDSALRQASSQRRGGGSGDDGSKAAWVSRAGEAAKQALLVLARCGGAAVLEELRAAATAGSFQAVLCALNGGDKEEVGEEEARGQAAAAAAAPAGTAAPRATVAATASVAASAGPEAAATTACAACSAADAPLMCAGCRGARYCGPECQKRDWRVHKAACKQRRQQQQQQ